MRALFFENRLAKVVALKALEKIWRNAALGPFSPLCYTNVPEPRLPNPRWIKVRNLQCGLCGTDLHFMFMDLDPKCFSAAVPGIRRKFLGHELVGEVVETGAEAAEFAVGDRVVLRIDWPSCAQLEIDPPCTQCASGNYMLCEKLAQAALPIEDVGGGFSPFMIMHRTQPFRVPGALTNDQAVLIEPLASAVHGVMKAPPAENARVLVIGGGTMGLLTVAALRAIFPAVSVQCLARYPFQARIAEKLGAKTIPEGHDLYPRVACASAARYIHGPFGNEIVLGGFDIIYDTIGNDATIQNALRWARGRGTVVLLGINFKPGKIDYSPVWCQEVNLMGINCHATERDGRTSFQIAAELLERGAADPADFITHRFPMHRYKNAVHAFLDKRGAQAIKIVLTHDSSTDGSSS